MSVVLRPFEGYRPRPELAEQIASPPYDVMNSEEARKMAEGNRLSFLHVVKPEIDLDPGIDLYDDRVYAKGKENFDRLMKASFSQDEKPCFYLYQQRMGDHVQAGIVGCASIDDYMENRIKKHELTRADKEADRTRHMDTLNANAGPVFLTYKAEPAVDQLMEGIKKAKPVYDFVSPDGVGHTFWVVSDGKVIAAIEASFGKIPCAYVADGHHRTASGVNVGKQRREKIPGYRGDEEYNYFMAVFFPHDQLRILDYNRVVKDLNGMDPETFLVRAANSFEVRKEAGRVKPDSQKTFGMFLDGSWYRLTAKEGAYPSDDPVGSLDVAILQNNLLGPILGIKHPRKDKRIDFVWVGEQDHWRSEYTVIVNHLHEEDRLFLINALLTGGERIQVAQKDEASQ